MAVLFMAMRFTGSQPMITIDVAQAAVKILLGFLQHHRAQLLPGVSQDQVQHILARHLGRAL